MPSPAAPAPRADRERQALQAVMDLFSAVRQAVQRDLSDTDSPAGLAPMHLRLLQWCDEAPGITQQGLVQRTGRDKGQIARLVKDLLAAGLLAREPHPGDGRSHCLQPTAAGRAACAQFAGVRTAVAGRLFGPSSDEDLSRLTADLQALQARLPGRHAEEH